jgi:hypothetical protein
MLVTSPNHATRTNRWSSRVLVGSPVKPAAEPARDTGAAAVEFALVSVLLLTLLFGIIQYAYFFFQSQGASATARETARLAAVGVSSCQNFEEAAIGRASANGTDLADDSYPTSDVSLTVRDPADSADRTVATAAVGDLAIVRVRWVPQKFGFPFVPFLSGDRVEVAQTRIERLDSPAVVSC